MRSALRASREARRSQPYRVRIRLSGPADESLDMQLALLGKRSSLRRLLLALAVTRPTG